MQNGHMHIQYLIEQAHHCENELSGSLASPCNFALLLFFPCFFLLFQSKKKNFQVNSQAKKNFQKAPILAWFGLQKSQKLAVLYILLNNLSLIYIII